MSSVFNMFRKSLSGEKPEEHESDETSPVKGNANQEKCSGGGASPMNQHKTPVDQQKTKRHRSGSEDSKSKKISKQRRVTHDSNSSQENVSGNFPQ